MTPPNERGRVLRPGHTQSFKLSMSDCDTATALAQARHRARSNRLTKVQQLELTYYVLALLDILSRDGDSSPARTRSCFVETPLARWARSQRKQNSPQSRKNGALEHGGSWPHRQSHRSKGRKR
jgi:hypothetical protein